MTEAELTRAARAIGRVMRKTNGQAGAWTLARAALMAANAVSHETASYEGERIVNSTAKAKSLRNRAINAAASRKRVKLARAAALEAERAKEAGKVEADAA